MPQPEPTSVTWPAQVAMQTAPNFEAPSAVNCARPVQTVEIPGRSNLPEQGGGRRRAGRELARGEPSEATGAASEDRADVAVAAAPPPAAALAPSPSSAPSRLAESASAAMGSVAKSSSAPPPGVQVQPPRRETVTAGMVDDNGDFPAYLQFRQRTASIAHRDRDVSERYLLQVRNAAGATVADAEVAVRSANGAAMWARTDTAGRVWLHPNAFDPSGSQMYEIAARKNGLQATSYLRRGQKSAVDLTLDARATPARAKLDLVFLVDATGSMGDEIGKLKATLRTIADEVARLPSRPDTCFGLVAYRDRGDAFLLRRHDLTNDLSGFQSVLNALQADGGGDYPEAMNEAFHDTVHKISWRGAGATRLVVLLADAPPHLDYGGPQYDDDMVAALGKGIKVFSVGASGLDKQGEYIQRQIAQYTGGRFVFLTYKDGSNPASGPGRETVHDVSNYSVQTLDRLIVRLVREELEKLSPA
ncbi:VWA domain-containing protein [Variovorax sp. J22R133]|uniref:vWA domain-containing protein n=1 Tax=Variovorax brevis TaxID=3053503 RepID=UPI0025781313|nr:vWA domain-containing protein [Variovorax sp. J22R133]MDM0114925.1 VWA domain-containing protein [Variovorax sp. J22R133]